METPLIPKVSRRLSSGRLLGDARTALAKGLPGKERSHVYWDSFHSTRGRWTSFTVA